MTDRQQIICYEVWEYNGKLLGSLIDWKPAFQAKKDYPVCFDIRGQQAHFMILSNDLSMTRQDAIDFCTAIFLGKYRTHHVDLKQLEKAYVRERRK